MKHPAHWVSYALGVGCVACGGFTSPWWFVGFLPLGAGLIWAAYDVIDVEDASGDAATAPRR